MLVEEFLGRYDEHPAEADWYAGFERDPHDECVALPPVAPVELARAA